VKKMKKQDGKKKSGRWTGEKVLAGKKRVETYMSPELAQRLTDFSARTGIPYWAVIEIALKAHLDEVEGPYAREERERVHIQFDSQGRPHYPGE